MEVLDCVLPVETFKLFISETFVTIQEHDIRRMQVAIAKGDLKKEDVEVYQVVDKCLSRLTFMDDGSIEEDIKAFSVISDLKIELMRIKRKK